MPGPAASTDRQCTANSRTTGERCGNWAMQGLTVCRFHGGKTNQRVGQRRLEERAAKARAEREVQRLGASGELQRFTPAREDTSPGELLLGLIRYQSGIVNFWREQVAFLSDEDMVFGVTKTEKGRDRGERTKLTTKEAGANVAYRLLVEAQDKLADYCTRALRAGVEERKVRVAEQTGTMFITAVRSILADLGLTPEQEALVGEVVPRHLRAVSQATQSVAGSVDHG